MNHRITGTMLIIAGIILSLLFLGIKASNDAHMRIYILESGSCFLDDGTCLHAENDNFYYIVGWIISAALVILGSLMILSYDYNRRVEENNKRILEDIRKVREEESEKSSFEAFLKGFDEDERKVIRIIRGQQGIKQNTLRLKAELSKTGLSLMLQSLEKRGIIEKKPEGKTNSIFLKGYYGRE